MNYAPFQKLPTRSLEALVDSLRGGVLSLGLSRKVIQQIAGSHVQPVEHALRELETAGLTPLQMSFVVEGVLRTREATPDFNSLLELVLSGPDVPNVPTRDTEAVMHALIEETTSEVLLVGYAIHNGRQIFAPLAAKMLNNPALTVKLCIDIGRKYQDTSTERDIVGRFLMDFKQKHWPWESEPTVFFDPRALSSESGVRSSLHAKCVVVDRRVALVTSANFTEAAQERNIEAGGLVRHAATAQRLTEYFVGLIAHGVLRRCEGGRG